MGIFYDSERYAFSPDIVVKSFHDVGLWPWNPEKNKEMFEKYASPDPLLEENEFLLDLTEAMKKMRDQQQAECNRLLSEMK